MEGGGDGGSSGGGSGMGHLFVTVFLSTFAWVVVIPGITDVTMAALCPGEDECSLAIYLSGLQQAITGVGTVVMLPLIGSLSDVFGRKAMLTLPMTLSIIPSAILACNTTRSFFYAYYVSKTLVAMACEGSIMCLSLAYLVYQFNYAILACNTTRSFFYAYYVSKTLVAMACEGSIMCLSLAYLADNVPEDQRAPAFGVISGVGSAAFVGGMLAARFLPTARTFQVSTAVSMIAVVYMRIFLKDTKCNIEALRQPILKVEEDSTGESSKKMETFTKMPSPKEVMGLLRHSTAFTQAAFVTFFDSLAHGGFIASVMYFLKAQFHFSKNQYADLLLIESASGTISQLVLMPILAPILGESKLMSVGLFFTFLSFVVNSVAWSYWVPYAASLLGVFGVLVTPCIRSIVSKQVGPNEQGMAQGCISSITSFANIISPFIFSPLTDLFLSSRAPFHYPGFSLMCASLATMIAFITSAINSAVSPISGNKFSYKDQTGV